MVDEDKKLGIMDLCTKKENYLLAFKAIYAYESGEKPMPDRFGWSMYDVRGMSTWLLNELRQREIIKTSYESGKGKWFRLADDISVEKLKAILGEVDVLIKHKNDLDTSNGSKITFDDEPLELPGDLFSIISGHEDVKYVFDLSLRAEKPVHVLLVGKPACAKSMFLEEANRLKGAAYALAGTSTKAGLRDMIASGVRFLLIDELDKIDNPKDLSVLLQWMESGTMPVLMHNRYCVVSHPGWVFAACNNPDKIPPEIKSRCVKMKIPEYTEEELIAIIIKICVEREGKTEELAQAIADAVVGKIKSRDPRDGTKIARLAKTKEDVDRIAGIMKRYKL